MTELRSFEVRQIVWAKVGDYPWWPGRIISSLQQNDTDVYKVNFFGDPTYSYLQANYILHFDQLQIPTEGSLSWDSKLKKPLQLAIKALKKKKSQSNKNQKYTNTPSPNFIHLGSSFEEIKIESKENIQIIEKTLSNEQTIQNIHAEGLETLIKVEPDIQNVIDLLNSNVVSKLRQFKGYNKRKIALDFVKNLQTTLLKKYQLDQIDQCIVKKSKLLLNHSQKKMKKRPNLCLKKASIKKLYQVLKNKNLDNIQRKSLAIKVVNKLEQLYPGFDNMYRKYYILFIKWSQSATHYQLTNVETQFFTQVIALKKDDSQNSKLTQISIMEQ